MGIIDTSMIKIEIDGIEFNVKKGSKIIEIADEVGIYIPRFCYHKKLSIAANCRMCLIEVAKTPKLFPACATPVADGMKIFTNTEKVIEAQKSVMEFLLINHPLDCPICDQGGECELQDLTVGYGCVSSRFIEKKRSFNDYDIGPLVSTDVTRCILCTRCVRFCEEIAGTKEIGVINRGNDSRIFTFLKKHLVSEISGNVIDLCPVGALTAKPSRFKYRAWELIQHSFISCHDSIGSNLFVHVFKDKVIRIIPKKNNSINESWISDRDRFSYEGLYSSDRITNPMIKINGVWENVSWDESFKFISESFDNIKTKFGSDQIGCLASPNSTIEELFILQKLVRNIGSNNIDHRLNQTDFLHQENFPLFPGIDINLDEISNLDCIFLIGSNITKDNPIIALKIRKLLENGGKFFVLNPIDFEFFMDISGKFIVNPTQYIDILNNLIDKLKSKNFDFNFNNKNLNLELKKFLNFFVNAKKKLILLGSFVISSPDYSTILGLSIKLSKLLDSFFGILSDGANTNGAWLSGFLPHRLPGGKILKSNFGLNSFEMLSKNLKGYILFGLELEYDCLYPNIAFDALKNSIFTLSFTSFYNKFLFDNSNVILPIASSYENSGTFVNISGIWQSFTAVVPCSYNIKLGWKALINLANYLKFSDFFYKDVFDISKELKLLIDFNSYISWNLIEIKNLKTSISNEIIFLDSISMYDSDSLVRRAASLQKAIRKNSEILRCNKFTYNSLKLDNNVVYFIENLNKIKYFVFIDNSLSDNIIYIDNSNFENYRKYQLPYNVFKFER